VIATLWKVRYAATTESKVPDLHSLINSSRDRALGSMTSAISEIEAHSLCALNNYFSKAEDLREKGEDRVPGNILVDFSQKENLWLRHGQYLLCFNGEKARG